MSDNWAGDFHFSEDLRQLETEFQITHQDALRAVVTGSPAMPATASTLTSDEATLNSLSEKIALKLTDVLSESDILENYSRAAELESENEELLLEIERLQRQILELETQLRDQEFEIQSAPIYRPVFGGFYVKRA